MAAIADSADVAFDVVAPVAEVPSSVHSTTPSYADPMIGQYSANGNDAGQVQLGDLTAAPTIIPDSVTTKILDVESAQVPSIGSMVDVGSDFSEESDSEDSEEDEFIPRGGTDNPGVDKNKPLAKPKVLNKTPASGTQAPVNAGASSLPALPANPPTKAQPSPGTTAPSAGSPVKPMKIKTKKA